MTEMENNVTVEQATTDVLDSFDFDESGIEAIGGAVLGAGLAGTAGFKLGYTAGVKDAAAVTKKDPKKLLDDIRKLKGKKEKKGGILGTGWTVQNPFKKVEKPEDTTSKGTEDKKDSEADKE